MIFLHFLNAKFLSPSQCNSRCDKHARLTLTLTHGYHFKSVEKEKNQEEQNVKQFKHANKSQIQDEQDVL
jgi:hypothetical protein